MKRPLCFVPWGGGGGEVCSVLEELININSCAHLVALVSSNL